MSIATDITVDIVIDNVKVDEYELSDTLDNYDITEILAAAYCGCYNVARRNNFLKTTDYGWVGAFDKDSGVCQYPFKITPSGGSYIWDTGATGYNTPDGIYSGVIWLKHELATECETVITQNNAADYRMVTKWNVNKFVFTLPELSSRFTEVAQTTWVQADYPCCYVPEYWGTMTYHTARGLPYDQTVNVSICPYHVYIFDDQIFLHAIKVESDFIYNSTQEVYTKVFGESRYLSFDGTTSIATSYNNNYLSVAKNNSTYNTNFDLSGYPGNNRFPVSWQGPGGYGRWYQIGGEDQQNYLTLWDHSGYSSTGGYIRINNHFSKVDDVLHYFANMGVYFYADKLYKPIIEDTIVTGYTDDMETASDIDNWDGDTIHDVPITPPVPPPTPGEDAEPETFGWGGNEVGGMVHYYLLTQSEMESLAGFMSNPNWTIDYRNCIVSMFIIPNNGTVVFDDDTFESTTVKFRLDENNKVDTGISCNRIHNVVNNHGTIEIPRMNNNFLDYEPYSKYYVYVPFCGVTSLPDYIAGKEITVSIYPDVPTCSCTAVISSEGRKIATLRGNFGSSIPVTSDGSGLKTAAVINSMANGLVGLGEMAAGAGLDNPGLVIGGGMTAISSILQTALTFGQAFGYSVGSSGDTSFFGIGNRCEYYIAYPQWNNPDGEDTNIYGHTYGFVVNKRGIIGDFEGFTVCDNPHVTGFSCTSDEKDEIERLLCKGIIIHKPSE